MSKETRTEAHTEITVEADSHIRCIPGCNMNNYQEYILGEIAQKLDTIIELLRKQDPHP